VWIVPNVEIWAFGSAMDVALPPPTGGGRGAAGPDVISFATRSTVCGGPLAHCRRFLEQPASKQLLRLEFGVAKSIRRRLTR